MILALAPLTTSGQCTHRELVRSRSITFDARRAWRTSIQVAVCYGAADVGVTFVVRFHIDSNFA